MLAILGIGIALVVVTTSGCAVWRIQQAAELARQSEPFEVAPEGATASLLIVGDSTAVGTGASSPATSVAGLISRAHPSLRIVNRARDGARFADVVTQLESSAIKPGGPDAGERFDAVLVLAGGNDVIRLTREAPLSRDISHVAEIANVVADVVVMVPSGNVGSAPFFFPPWSWLMTQRSKMLHRLVSQAAARTGASYVNLFQEKADDPFAQRPDEMNAKDGLHPSDAGYKLWVQQINAQTDLGKWVEGRPAPLDTGLRP